MISKLKDKNNLFFFISSLLVVAFIVMQLYVLTNVGTKGEEISKLRNQETAIQLDNEIKKAHIMQLQTDQAVVGDVSARMQVENKHINIITPEAINVTAEK